MMTSRFGTTALCVALALSFPTSSTTADAAERAVAAGTSEDVAPNDAQRARKIAEGQPSFVAAAKRGRVVFIGVEKVRIKQKSGARRHLLRTIHYRYVDDVTTYTAIDPTRGAVVNVVERKHVPTPLSREEREEATKLARTDPELKRILGPRLARLQIEMLAVRTSNRKDPIFGHRAVVLLFRDGSRYVAGYRVVVDLTAGKVSAVRIVSKPSHHGRPQ